MSARRVQAQDAQIFFEDAMIYALDGLANWSGSIESWIEEGSRKGLPVVWLVSDWRFNNEDFPSLREEPLFLPGARGRPNNIMREFMSASHVRRMAEKGVQVIDYLVEKHPTIKLIFWCLYQRTRNNRSSTVSEEHSYDAMLKRYSRNAVDIDAYLRAFDTSFSECVLDDGGHPNRLGYQLLRAMFIS